LPPCAVWTWRRHGLTQKHGGFQVERDHAVIAFFGGFEQQLLAVNADRIDQDVAATEVVAHCVDGAADVFHAPSIERDRAHVGPQLDDAVRHLVQTAVLGPAHRDLRTGARKTTRDGLADHACAAGDERHFAGQRRGPGAWSDLV
jgi:hypothetical protein